MERSRNYCVACNRDVTRVRAVLISVNSSCIIISCEQTTNDSPRLECSILNLDISSVVATANSTDNGLICNKACDNRFCTCSSLRTYINFTAVRAVSYLISSQCSCNETCHLESRTANFCVVSNCEVTLVRTVLECVLVAIRRDTSHCKSLTSTIVSEVAVVYQVLTKSFLVDLDTTRDTREDKALSLNALCSRRDVTVVGTVLNKLEVLLTVGIVILTNNTRNVNI